GEHFGHKVGLNQPGGEEIVAAALLTEVPRRVFGIEASSRTGDDVDDIVAVRCSGAHENATQPESRIRVDSVTHWFGDLRQPGGHQLENTVREHLGVFAERTQFGQFAGVEHPVELDGPYPTVRPLPRGIVT